MRFITNLQQSSPFAAQMNISIFLEIYECLDTQNDSRNIDNRKLPLSLSHTAVSFTLFNIINHNNRTYNLNISLLWEFDTFLKKTVSINRSSELYPSQEK